MTGRSSKKTVVVAMLGLVVVIGGCGGAGGGGAGNGGTTSTSSSGGTGPAVLARAELRASVAASPVRAAQHRVVRPERAAAAADHPAAAAAAAVDHPAAAPAAAVVAALAAEDQRAGRRASPAEEATAGGPGRADRRVRAVWRVRPEAPAGAAAPAPVARAAMEARAVRPEAEASRGPRSEAFPSAPCWTRRPSWPGRASWRAPSQFRAARNGAPRETSIEAIASPRRTSDEPYRLYVPTNWDGQAKLPLVMFLHGSGADESTYIDANNKQMLTLAQQRGYILVAPLGDAGAYGNFLRLSSPFGKPDEAAKLIAQITPDSERTNELSEKDVINVLELILAEYPVDRAAMFLTGHSMGSGGTWYIGGKYPSYWKGLAPMSGPFVQETGYPWDGVRPHLPLRHRRDPGAVAGRKPGC